MLQILHDINELSLGLNGDVTSRELHVPLPKGIDVGFVQLVLGVVDEFEDKLLLLHGGAVLLLDFPLEELVHLLIMVDLHSLGALVITFILGMLGSVLLGRGL